MAGTNANVPFNASLRARTLISEMAIIIIIIDWLPMDGRIYLSLTLNAYSSCMDIDMWILDILKHHPPVYWPGSVYLWKTNICCETPKIYVTFVVVRHLNLSTRAPVPVTISRYMNAVTMYRGSGTAQYLWTVSNCCAIIKIMSLRFCLVRQPLRTLLWWSQLFESDPMHKTLGQVSCTTIIIT